MFEAIPNRYLVPFDGKFSRNSVSTRPPDDAPGKKKNKTRLEELVDRMREQQRRLYAQDTFALLLVFQAIDAAGKDGTVRAVMSGVNPAGCQVFSFKQPSAEELDHDFLWRTTRCLPQRGRIGIFNRSYYEEVLVVRVHPQFLEGQKLPYPVDLDSLWGQRFESIRDHELHLARNGTVILKFWLNVSKAEQRRRFLARIDDAAKNWKFSERDVREREHWNAYMNAYEEAVRETSRPWAPWYAIPADDKPFMRVCVAETIVSTLESLDLRYPELPADEVIKLAEARAKLERER